MLEGPGDGVAEDLSQFSVDAKECCGLLVGDGDIPEFCHEAGGEDEAGHGPVLMAGTAEHVVAGGEPAFTTAAADFQTRGKDCKADAAGPIMAGWEW
jgi:hypothetical protein